MLQAGYAEEVITPELDRAVYLAGFGRDRRAEGVHDDLYVRALALSNGSTRLVLAALDLIGLGRPLCQEVARRLEVQRPGAQLLLAATHTHHGPDTLGLWGPDLETSGVDPTYVKRVLATSAGVATRALDSLAPAEARIGVEYVPDVVRNARDPEVVDAELNIMHLEREGAPPITLLILPCHPEVLWNQNPLVTADYPWALLRRVQQATEGEALFFVGALGGMLTPDVPAHTFVEAEEMGEQLAAAALRALEQAPAAPLAEIAHARREVAVPLQNPVLQMAADRGLIPDPRDTAGRVNTEVSLTRLGPLWLAGVPGEMLPRLGLELRQAMRSAGAAHAAVIGLANDELGYILPEEDYVYPDDPMVPGDHYEETMSLGPAAGPAVMEALQDLIEGR